MDHQPALDAALFEDVCGFDGIGCRGGKDQGQDENMEEQTLHHRYSFSES
jgi:hypothetical protein